jgi:hypothetical protein
MELFKKEIEEEKKEEKNVPQNADIPLNQDIKTSPVGVQPREVPEDVLRKILGGEE